MKDLSLPTAPFFGDIVDGPNGGAAYWLSADGVRIRVLKTQVASGIPDEVVKK